MKKFLKQLILTNAVLLILTVITVLYCDRSIAFFMHNNGFDQIKELRVITEYLPIIVMVFIIVVILSKTSMKFRTRLVLGAYFYISLYITMEIKTGLKIIFGRYWPETWNNNLSLISNNVFGFNFWHGMGKMGSFPSGHTTYITFCAIWLIHLISSKKNWLLGVCFLVPISLTISNYHFLGDCLAGLILGMNCAILSLYAQRKIGIGNE